MRLTQWNPTHYITIQRGTVSRDAHGAEILTYADLVSLWAEIVYTGGSEGQAASKETANMNVSFKVRYVSDTVTEKDRIVHKGYYHDITAVTPDVDGRKHFQIIETEFRR